jgi:hypothetical protein
MWLKFESLSGWVKARVRGENESESEGWECYSLQNVNQKYVEKKWTCMNILYTLLQNCYI